MKIAQNTFIRLISFISAIGQQKTHLEKFGVGLLELKEDWS